MTVLPEVNFIDANPEDVKTSVIRSYEEKAGRTIAHGDPMNLILHGLAAAFVQQRVALNDGLKQRLLTYARGPMLDHKGSRLKTPRNQAVAAFTTLRFHLSAVRENATLIPVGTLVCTKAMVYFTTKTDVIIQPGVLYGDVEAECTENGDVGNNIGVGMITELVRPIPYVKSVENISMASGGAKAEGDDPYRERIHQAPEKFSVAGPDGAYIYWAHTASSLIKDVSVYSDIPGHVQVRAILENGELPSQEIIELIEKTLSDKTIRPLTDYLHVSSPNVHEYELEMTYYIEKNVADSNLIKANIETAIEEYRIWQKSKIGRDINPSKLISNCITAGAKRVAVVSPQFVPLNTGSEGQDAQIAQEVRVAVTFGGEEDD